jgi:dTDP-6-deoxy-L-talose 4-dehydrogenase (NAD+)
MKVLITGSSGFIGKRILDILKSDESIEIISTTRHKENIKEDIYYYDIYNCDFEIDLFDYFEKPDVILHCAWDNVKDVNQLSHINDQVFFHIKFLENLIKNGAKKVSILGTCFEYGKINGEISENALVNPITSYAIAKDFLRRYIELLNKDYDFIFQWIRIFYVYDKTGETGNNIVNYLRKAIDSNQTSFNMTDGKKELDFIEINELCDLIIKIISQDQVNGIINCCSGKPQSISNLVDKCLSEWGAKIFLNKGYYKAREFEPDYFYGNTKLLNKILAL